VKEEPLCTYGSPHLIHEREEGARSRCELEFEVKGAKRVSSLFFTRALGVAD